MQARGAQHGASWIPWAAGSRCRPDRSAVQVVCGRKGDGKQRRKPKGPESDSEPELPAPPPPPRITNHTAGKATKSLIRTIKRVVAESKRPAGPALSVAYRRASLTAEEIKEQRRQQEEADRREAEKLAKQRSRGLQQIWDSNDGRAPPVLLVDGYNVLHKWPDTMHLMSGDSADFEAARQQLVEELILYSQQNGILITVAFDAMGSGCSSEEMRSVVRVVYCGDEEADSFLVREAERKLQAGHTRIVVATDDSMPAMGVVSAKPTGDVNTHTWAIRVDGLLESLRATKRRFAETKREFELRQRQMQSSSVAKKAGKQDVSRQLSDLAAQLRQQEAIRAAAEREAARAEKRRREEEKRQVAIARMLEWQAQKEKEETDRAGGTGGGQGPGSLGHALRSQPR